MIRSAPAITTDSIYCARLGSNAVHAAMAGKTEVLISLSTTISCICPYGSPCPNATGSTRKALCGAT